MEVARDDCKLTIAERADLILAAFGKKIRKDAAMEDKTDMLVSSSTHEGLEETGREAVELNFEGLYAMWDGTRCHVPTSAQCREAWREVDMRLRWALSNYSSGRDRATIHRFEAEKLHQMMRFINRSCARKDLNPNRMFKSMKIGMLHELYKTHHPCAIKIGDTGGTGQLEELDFDLDLDRPSRDHSNARP